MSEKLSERMHEAAIGGLGYIQDLDEWSEEVATLEAKLEAMERALESALSDLQWAEQTLPGTNFQASILMIQALAAAQEEQEW